MHAVAPVKPKGSVPNRHVVQRPLATRRAIAPTPPMVTGLIDAATNIHRPLAPLPSISELFGDDYDRTVIRSPAPTEPPDPLDAFGAARPAEAPARPSAGSLPGPGTLLAGKYELREKVAQGTFGVVYTARDTNLDRDVAIKLLNPAHVANAEILQRFVQEARAAARICHGGIVTIFECGSIDGGAFIAMELLQGENLTARIARRGRLAPEEAADIARQVASAIDAAHRADVLHRDLKPDNIFLVPDAAMPTGERVKVLDFGLAKLGLGGQTQMGTVFGTPRYMSPEQCRSAASIDQRSDVYALGCILFELVTGRAPFDGGLRELVERHQRAPIPRAQSFAPELSYELDELIYQMLQKDPAARPQTMAAVQRALRPVGIGSGPQPTLALPAQLIGFAATVEQARLAAPGHRRPRLRRAPVIAAAIAFVVAAALTAIAARASPNVQAAPTAPPVVGAPGS